MAVIRQGDSWLAKVVTSNAFDWGVCVLIILNAVSLGWQIDYVSRHQPDAVPAYMRWTERSFCAAFIVELALRMRVHGLRFFTSPEWHWNMFDCFIVGMQLVEEVVTFLWPESLGILMDNNLILARMVRVLRLVKVIRLVRVLRLIRELRLLVTSITSSLKSLGWTVLLLVFMIYTVSLVLTQVVTDHRSSHRDEPSADMDDLKTYYGSLGRSMLSLFEAVSGGVDWDTLVRPLVEEISPVLALFFSLYIAFAMLAMLNVVTGVFVESVLLSAKADKDLFLVSNAREIMNSFDDDNTAGKMTLQDFLNKADSQPMQEFFKGIDVDPDDASSLFALMDFDESGELDAEEFLSGCIRLREPARALDTAVLAQQVRRVAHELQVHSRHIEEALARPAASEEGDGDARSRFSI